MSYKTHLNVDFLCNEHISYKTHLNVDFLCNEHMSYKTHVNVYFLLNRYPVNYGPRGWEAATKKLVHQV